MKKQELRKATLQSQSGQKPKRKNFRRKIKKNTPKNLNPRTRKSPIIYMAKRRPKGSILNDGGQRKTKGRQKKQEHLFKIDIKQIEKLVDQGITIKESFSNKNTKNKIQKYMEEVKKLFGMKLFKKYLEAPDFNSLLDKLKDLHYQKLKRQILEKDGLLYESYYYSKQKKLMTLQNYKSLIESYRKNGNAVKATYDQINQNNLFKWVKKQNKTYQRQLNAKRGELVEKLKEEAGSKKRKIQSQLKILNEQGAFIFNDYVDDIKDLLKGGFLIQIKEEENRRLLADLLSYGFRLRYKAFFDYAESSKSSQLFSLEQNKYYQYYSQATIKSSSLSDQYFKAAQQVINSVHKSQVLFNQIVQYLVLFSIFKINVGQKNSIEEQVKNQFQNGINYGFFDYDFPLNGVTVCKDSQLKIYFNTFFDYNPYGKPSKEQIDLFKTFIFYTYLHELAHYLIRSLKISGYQKSSFDLQSSAKKKEFKEALNLEIEEKDIQESGHIFQRYLFGRVIDHIFSSQYNNFMLAQKEKNFDLRQYFQKEEKKKDKKKQRLKTIVQPNRAFRSNCEIGLSREIPKEWCGTHFEPTVRPKK